MKKRILSIILIVISLFTLVFPVSAYAGTAMEEPDYVYTKIEIQGKDAWGNYSGGWYYKTWTGKATTPKVNIWEKYGKKIDGEWIYEKKNLVEKTDYVKSFGNNRDMGYCRLYVAGQGDYSDVDIVKAAEDSKTDWLESITQEQYLSILRYGYDKGPIFVIRPLGTKLNKVKGQKKAVKVTWKKQAKKMSVKRITGYQIQLSTRKDFETYRLVTVKGYKNTAKTVKKLKAKKKYYVRVRTYFQCKDGFKSYSTWSKAKTVKTK